MRIALLTEGGYPFARGESFAWCDRLLRGLDRHEFEVYALSRSAAQERADRCALPANVRRVRTASLWGPPSGAVTRAVGGRGYGHGYGRGDRQRFTDCFARLASAVCAVPSGLARGQQDGEPGHAAGELADRFAAGLYGLADLARERGGLPAALRSELALRVLESACHTPGALRAAHSARVADLLAVAARLERALRPLSADWYGDASCAGGSGAAGEGLGPGRGQGPGQGQACGLAAADLCHAVGCGPAALPGLLAKRLFGTPLLITEYAVRLREHYLAGAADAVAPVSAGAPVRALLASFQRLLAQEAYGQAELITPGDAHARRWQERCGARRERLRTVYPGLDALPFAEVGEAVEAGERAELRRAEAPTLVRAGRVEPAKDVPGLLHAFSLVRAALPEARLRIVMTAPGRGADAAGHLQRCRELAARLFPAGEKQTSDGLDTPGPARGVPESPVTFEELGASGLGTLADAYASGQVAVDSSVTEGFPVSLVEAMFCASATVSTDVGAVREVIGGTGLVVPPRDTRALADGCVALLTDPARGARLGAAARARALELFTVERNTAAFSAIYLELMSHSRTGGACPVSDGGDGEYGRGAQPLPPFSRPAESHVPGRWAAGKGGRRGSAAAVAGGRRPAAWGGIGEPRPGVRHLGGPGRGVPSWARPDPPEAAQGTVAAQPGGRKPEEGEAE